MFNHVSGGQWSHISRAEGTSLQLQDTQCGRRRAWVQYAGSWHPPATMYVSYLLDKDVGMYPGSMRGHPGLQNYPTAPQYPDYGGYHGLSLESAAPSSGSPAWITPYGAPREEWGHTTYSTGHTPLNPSPGGSLGYSPVSDYPTGQVQGPPCVGVLPTGHQPQISPGVADGHRRHHYDWMRKPATQGSSGKKSFSTISRDLGMQLCNCFLLFILI